MSNKLVSIWVIQLPDWSIDSLNTKLIFGLQFSVHCKKGFFKLATRHLLLVIYYSSLITAFLTDKLSNQY